MLLLSLCSSALAADVPLPVRPPPPEITIRADAKDFLDLYNSVYLGLVTVDSEAAWAASTDVNDRNEGRRIAADEAYAAFVGDPGVIRTTKMLLAKKDVLEPLQVKQLESILLKAGAAPGTIPDVVAARIAAEAHQAAIQDAFTYCFEPLAADGTCAAPKTANDVDELLQNSKDPDERLKVWTASKEIGRPLKPGLVELQRLRNQVAREMGYSSYFGLQVAEYGMTTDEMMTLLDGFVTDSKPLYDSLYTWATRTLATRYGQPVPVGGVPAQWYPNRWAQEWGGLVEGVDLDPYFSGHTPESIVKQSEDFYVSLGFAPLPPSF